MMAPCKHCSNKGCGAYHAECEQYQEFRRMMDDINGQRHSEIAVYTCIKTKKNHEKFIKHKKRRKGYNFK